MDERHRRIAEIALSAAGKYSRALAGGYAIQAHGIGSRPSGEVDRQVDAAAVIGSASGAVRLFVAVDVHYPIKSLYGRHCARPEMGRSRG